MPLILGLEPSATQTVSEELLIKGIKLLKVTPSIVNAVGVPTLRQTAYTSYLNYLPAFMESSKKQEKVDVRLPGTSVESYADPTDLFPFSYPPLAVHFKDGGATAENQQAAVDLGAKVEIIAENKTFLFSAPTSNVIKALANLPINYITQCTDNRINFNALFSVRRTIMIFSYFFHVHAYPAYKNPEHHQDLWDYDLERAKATMKRPRDDHEIVDEERHSKAQNVAASGGSEASASTSTSVTVTPTTHKDTVMKIKTPPIFLPNTQAWVTRSTLPNTHGLFVPYFAETQHYDTKMVPAVVKQYFLGCLGETKNGIAEAFHTFCSNWGVIGKTELGKVLTHMAFVISVALPAQGRPVPIFDGTEYIGCFISGYGFVIGIGTQKYLPVSPVEVAAEVNSVSLHKNVLRKVLEAAGYDMDPMQEGSSILADTTLTALSLRAKLVAKGLTEVQRDLVRKYAKALNFKASSWANNHSTICAALDLVKIPITSWDTSTPIHPSVLFSNDPLELALSCFGLQAPSFWPIEGREIKLTTKTYDVTRPGKKGSGEAVVETRTFNKLFVREVALEQAFRDWKTIREKKSVKVVVQPRRSGKNADKELSGTSFDVCLAALKEFCGVDENDHEASASTGVTGAVPNISMNLDMW